MFNKKTLINIQEIFNLPSEIRKYISISISGIVALAFSLLLFTLPSINILDWHLSDLWVTEEYGSTTSENVAVIGIDDALFEEEGFEWPLDKDVYGELILFLTEMGAKVITFDILFANNLYDCGKGDSILGTMIELSQNVVLGFSIDYSLKQNFRSGNKYSIPKKYSLGPGGLSGFTNGYPILPYKDLLDRTDHIGAINISVPFADGINRKMPLFLVQDSLLFPSLGLESASIYANSKDVNWVPDDNTVIFNNENLWVDNNAHLYVDFKKKIPFYSMSDILQSHTQYFLGQKPSIGRGELEGRIIFVGNSALTLGDFGITPVAKLESSGLTPNVFMHARTADAIITNTFLKCYDWKETLILTIIVLIILMISFHFLPLQFSLIFSGLLFLSIFFTARWFFLNGTFIPILQSIVSGIIFSGLTSFMLYLEKDSDRRFLYKTFGKYISPHIIETMADQKIKPQLGGEEVYGTAFFSDIEGFSSFSEEMAPIDLISNLNEYFAVMTEKLINNNGTFDKYIGDAVVAFFGAPRPSHRHAYEACTAAVKMQEALAVLRGKWQKNKHLPKAVKEMKMRIGINTGHFITGNVGCETFMNYTMMGDTVNLASRLEGVGKRYGVYTVIGENTARDIKHDFLVRQLDKIRVKGRNTPSAIYQLMGIIREEDEQMHELIKTYEDALKLYFKQDFNNALKGFKKSLTLEKYPDLFNPSSVMMKRCEHLARKMPDSWDGVYTMKTK